MAQKEFRKPPRYMVGDIVYSHGFICIVCSIYPFNIDYSYDLKVYDEGTCTFNEVFENRTFVDGLPFGVKVEE